MPVLRARKNRIQTQEDWQNSWHYPVTRLFTSPTEISPQQHHGEDLCGVLENAMKFEATRESCKEVWLHYTDMDEDVARALARNGNDDAACQVARVQHAMAQYFEALQTTNSDNEDEVHRDTSLHDAAARNMFNNAQAGKNRGRMNSARTGVNSRKS